jgi:hypothetical protein
MSCSIQNYKQYPNRLNKLVENGYIIIVIPEHWNFTYSNNYSSNTILLYLKDDYQSIEMTVNNIPGIYVFKIHDNIVQYLYNCISKLFKQIK